MKSFKLCLPILLLLMVSCKHKYKFSCFFESAVYLPHCHTEVKASNDKEAYELSMKYLDSYMDASSDWSKYIASEKVKIYVYRKNQSSENKSKSAEYILDTLGIESKFLSTRAKYFKQVAEEENKAFAETEFGMSQAQVKSMPYFSHFYNLTYSNSIEASGIQIGDEYYTVKLYFGDNDELYSVDFSSFNRSATYLNTDIKDYVDNFKQVIEKSYGMPAINYGYPSILDLDEGMVTWAYIWTIGKKEIRIGVAEVSSGSEFRFFATIVDTEREAAIKNKAEQKKKEQRDSYSGLFR